jgi:TolB-like protein/DNA-binding winged helix-turn-helix (wHTH) protein/Flp pilus assembly protein TadD
MDLSGSGKRVARFGLYEADLKSCELTKGGLRIKLQDQPFQVLALLLEHSGEVVAREEFRQRLWSADTFVEFDDGLNSAVKKLRVALSDTADNPRFIETIPRKGYRFLAPVSFPAEWGTPPISVEQTTAEQSMEARALRGSQDRIRTSPVLTTTQRKKFWAGGLLAAGILLLLGLTVGGWRQRLFGRSAAAPIRSIAVLPLENLTGDPGQQYFTDGMTDALITSLAQIGSLRVISRTSTMHYRDSKKTLPEIANELGVDAVVEGSVARSGNRVRIDAQLIQAPTDRHLWAKSYERDIQDVLALQGELARTIAAEVQIQLTPKEQAQLANARPVNPDAYDAYLQGRFFWNKRNKEAINKGIEYFNEAIRLDPKYAAAYSGLADAYTITGCGVPAGMSMQEARPKAKAAALKAVELDDNSAEAHSALGFQKLCYDGDQPGAESEFKRAIALNPNYAMAHHGYAVLLLGDRNQEALDQVRQALRLDPVSPNSNGLLGDLLQETRQYDKAVEQFRKTVELEPQQFNSRVRLGFAYALMHRYPEAENEFKKAEEISPGSVSSLGGLAYVHGLEGKKKQAEAMLSEVKALAEKTGHPWVVSLVCVGLDDKNEAIRWLQKADEEGDFYLDLENPLLDSLRSDPRFQDLERRAKIAQPTDASK